MPIKSTFWFVNASFFLSCLLPRPFWLSPRQVMVVPVASKFDDYAAAVSASRLVYVCATCMCMWCLWEVRNDNVILTIKQWL